MSYRYGKDSPPRDRRISQYSSSNYRSRFSSQRLPPSVSLSSLPPLYSPTPSSSIPSPTPLPPPSYPHSPYGAFHNPQFDPANYDPSHQPYPPPPPPPPPPHNTPYDSSPSPSPSPHTPYDPSPSPHTPYDSSSPHTPYNQSAGAPPSPGSPYRSISPPPERPAIDSRRQLRDIQLFERTLRERYRSSIWVQRRCFLGLVLIFFVLVTALLSVYWDCSFSDVNCELDTLYSQEQDSWFDVQTRLIFSTILFFVLTFGLFKGIKNEYLHGPSTFLERCNGTLKSFNISFSEKDCKLIIRQR